jgi:hypothetical protein
MSVANSLLFNYSAHFDQSWVPSRYATNSLGFAGQSTAIMDGMK